MKTISIMSMLSVGLLLVLPLNGQTLNTLYSFGHNELGYQPYAITIGSSGQIFGTSPNGGAYGYGVVFELAPPSAQGGAWSYSVLHSFNPQNGETWPPAGNSLTLGPSGLVYGVAGGYGTDYGVVYRLVPPSAPSTQWHENTLLALPTDLSGGATPEGALSIGPQGALYGSAGGGGAYSGGVVFRLSPPASEGSTWTEQVLYNFNRAIGDGTAPFGPLTSGSDGAIYGVTKYGPSVSMFSSVYQLVPPGTAAGVWSESVLYSFSGSPQFLGFPNGVIMGPGGVLYGTAAGFRALAETMPPGLCSN